VQEFNKLHPTARQ